MSKFSQLTREERRIRVKLRSEDKTYRKIGKLFNKSQVSIYKICKTYEEKISFHLLIVQDDQK